MRVQWCRRGCAGGASAPPKVLVCQKSGKHPWKFGKILKILAKTLSRENPWKPGQKLCPTLFDFKKWRPTFAEQEMKTFFWMSHPKRSSWSLWVYICRQKLHKNVLGKFGKIRAKILCTPKNLLAPTRNTYAWVVRLWTQFFPVLRRKTDSSCAQTLPPYKNASALVVTESERSISSCSFLQVRGSSNETAVQLQLSNCIVSLIRLSVRFDWPKFALALDLLCRSPFTPFGLITSGSGRAGPSRCGAQFKT